MRIVLYLISIGLLAIGLYISYKFFEIIGHEYSYIGSKEIDMAATGQTGDFIGGIVGTVFSLAGFFILVLTFRQQNKSFIIERFENKFFELIKFHRENVNELAIELFEKDEDDHEEENLKKKHYTGKRVFVAIFKQFLECSNEIKPFFNDSKEEVFTKKYLEKIEKLIGKRQSAFPFKFLARIDIAYSIVFFGTKPDGLLVLQKLFKNRYRQGLVNNILKYVALKPTMEDHLWYNWRKLSKRNSYTVKLKLINEIYDARKRKSRRLTLEEIDCLTPDQEIVWNYHNRFEKYYGGHQFRLGHYFRHLFQSINFVNNQKGLSFNEKYKYVKILRAQLSTYEQALLFLNSLSSMGLVWEIAPKYKKSIFPFVTQYRIKQRRLITRFNLIKNLPGETLYGIPFKYFYPDVKYETDNQITKADSDLLLHFIEIITGSAKILKRKIKYSAEKAIRRTKSYLTRAFRNHFK